VALQQVAPGAVAERRRSLRGADDVREQHGGEHPVGLGRVPFAGQELLDLVHHRVAVADPRPVVVSGQLDEARAGDALRHM
jgi:hypothetical protein